MKGSRRSNNQKKTSSTNRVSKDMVPRTLPQLQDQLAIGFVYRFVTTNNFSGTMAVSTTNLLDAWFIAGTATNGYQLFDFVRVKKVVIRSCGVAQPYVAAVSNPSGPMATVGVDFVGLAIGSQSGGRQKSNSSMGYDVPAYVSLKPDPMSQAAQFQQSNGNTLFNIRAVDENTNALAGTVIDIHVTLRNSGAVNPAAIATARAGMTSGNLYFGGLDGLGVTTTQARSTFIPRF